VQAMFVVPKYWYICRLCPARMGFNTELQGSTSHEALIKLLDTEIQLLENIKKCVGHRVKSDRDYARALTQFSQFGSVKNPENFSSPLIRVSVDLLFLFRWKFS
jgi:hypothetical protein